MSRSGYSEECENEWALIRYRGAVKSAIRGARGQAFLCELLAALDSLSEKKLIVGDLEAGGEVCAIGAVGKARGIDMSKMNPEDAETVAAVFGIAPAMAREIVYENDEGTWYDERNDARFNRMRKWCLSNIKTED